MPMTRDGVWYGVIRWIGPEECLDWTFDKDWQAYVPLEDPTWPYRNPEQAKLMLEEQTREERS